MRSYLRVAIVVIGLGSITLPSQANTISPDDAGKILELWHRAFDFYSDILKIETGIAKSGIMGNREATQTYFCIQRIQAHAAAMERNLYAASVGTQMSAYLTSQVDEMITLDTVKTTLSQTVHSIEIAHDD